VARKAGPAATEFTGPEGPATRQYPYVRNWRPPQNSALAVTMNKIALGSKTAPLASTLEVTAEIQRYCGDPKSTP
jgi:hypothetical protein